MTALTRFESVIRGCVWHIAVTDCDVAKIAFKGAGFLLAQAIGRDFAREAGFNIKIEGRP